MLPAMADHDQEAAGTRRAAAFIDRWAASGAAERANYQLFLSELCDLLDVPRPNPAMPTPVVYPGAYHAPPARITNHALS